MRIHFTLLSGGLGGGSKIIIKLAHELEQRGHVVSLTCVATKKDVSWFKLKGEIIRISPYNFFFTRLTSFIKRRLIKDCRFRNRFYWDAIWMLAKNIPECDVSVATHALTAYSVFLSGKGRPFFYMQHFDALTLTDDISSERLFTGSYFLPLKKIANSTWLKNEIHNRCNLNVSDIEVVPSAVDTTIFYPRGHNWFGKKQEVKRIVCMGRPDDWKGFKDMLEAMEIVLKEKSVEFFVYAFKDNLPRRDNAPYTLLTGISGEKLACLLSSADIVVIPSWFESSPLPVLEAMACGAAVVTTRLGAEDLAVDEKNALVVDPRKPEDLAKKILLLINNESLRTKLIENGLESIHKFSWENTVKRVEGIFLNESL